MKVVFDTNVLVAAFATEGLCSKLLRRANRGDFEIYISPFIFREFHLLGYSLEVNSFYLRKMWESFQIDS